MHATDGIKRKNRALVGVVRGGHVPAGKFLISDRLRSLLVPFWVSWTTNCQSSHCV